MLAQLLFFTQPIYFGITDAPTYKEHGGLRFMHNNSSFDLTLFEGLQELADLSFPKNCANCGRKFKNANEFLKETESISENKSGLKESLDDDDSTIVELYRNCPCGSTLMDFFNNRRDSSEPGLKRRARFEELMDHLEKSGLDREIARQELLKVMQGETSTILKKFQPPR